MSEGIRGKHHEASNSSRRNPTSNTAALRSAEVPAPNPAGDSSMRNISFAKEQTPIAANIAQLPSYCQENELRQRRNFYVKEEGDGASDRMGRACDTTSAQSTNIHGQANYTLNTGTADAVPDMKLPVSRPSTGGIIDKVGRLRVLTARAEKLKGEQEVHQQRAQGLRGQIEAGELACGRMTQDVLKLQAAIMQMSQRVKETQDAIGIRKKHISEDERKLSQELLSRTDKMEQIMSIVSEINTLAVETSTEASMSGLNAQR